MSTGIYDIPQELDIDRETFLAGSYKFRMKEIEVKASGTWSRWNFFEMSCSSIELLIPIYDKIVSIAKLHF